MYLLASFNKLLYVCVSALFSFSHLEICIVFNNLEKWIKYVMLKE